jgi:hypothetical protein
MRKVVVRLLMSLDGVAESPDKWEFDSFDGDVSLEASCSR